MNKLSKFAIGAAAAAGLVLGVALPAQAATVPFAAGGCSGGNLVTVTNATQGSGTMTAYNTTKSPSARSISYPTYASKRIVGLETPWTSHQGGNASSTASQIINTGCRR